MATNKQISVVTANLSRDTNSIEYNNNMMESCDALPPAHRAVGLQNSFGVPSFSPWPLEQLVTQMRSYYPSNKINHIKVANTYLKEVKSAVQRGILIAKHQQLEDGLIPIEWRKLRTLCGRYGSRGSEKYWFDWFQLHHPILEKVKEGYKFGKQGTLTMARVTIDLEILIAGQDPAELYTAYYADQDMSKVDMCPIDQHSLANYIMANKAITRRHDRLNENLKLAQTILLISQAPQCRGFLPQIISESDFGRKYYKGINLQTASKIVRHAALGECHQYDIEASVFTWKLDFVKELYEIKLPATIEYLEFKNHHRVRLSQSLFESTEKGYVGYIKQAITAIGFGARKTNAVWMGEHGQWKKTALREIIKSPQLLDKFLNDSWVREFIQEQEAMNKLIWEEIKDYPMIKDDVNLRNLNNQVSKSKAIAKAYQVTERSMLNAMITLAEPSQVLLTCHDGFYTKQKARITDLKECLKGFLPSSRLDHELHTAYQFIDLTVAEQHRQHIEQEEDAAREANPYTYLRGTNEFNQLKKRYANGYATEGQDYYDGSVNQHDAIYNPMYENDETN